MNRSLRVRSGIQAVMLGCCLALSLVASCHTGEPAPQWIRYEVAAQNDRLLMDVTALSLQKAGFPVGSGIDPGSLTITTGWHNSLAPFRGDGFREKCEVHYERKAPRRYEVAIRVRREKNDDLLHPLDLSYAEWIQEPDDTDRARMVMQHIRSLLETNLDIDEKP